MALPWVEEASLLASSSLRRKGSLYIIASGVPRETELAIKALRDQYYGKVVEGADAAVELREALETANALLYSQRAIGVSCQAAVVLEGSRLFLAGAGDGAAYLYSGRDGTIERLRGAATMAPLGSQGAVTLGQAQRRLAEGDVALLVSPAVAEAPEAEIASAASLALGDGPQSCADRLVARASQESPEGSAAAIAITCVAARPSAPAFERRPRPVPAEEALPPSAAERSPRGRRLWLGLVALGLLVLAFFGVSRLYPLLAPVAASPTPLPQTPTPLGIVAKETLPMLLLSPIPTEVTLTPQPSGTWQRIDELWREGEKGGEGSTTAWREAISLLEQLRAKAPNDPLIEEKLSVARLNLAYRAGMQKVDFYWCNSTAAATVLSWHVVVNTLEELYVQPLSPSWMSSVKVKLYSAHMNCGRALETAGRGYEAEGHYRRASQIR